jgi:alpha-amylase/alpha-mannosidase (GH57 family)
MEKYICIHGHFYQPPRENPWLEAIEVQDSAYPYHDWNERILVECYAPNTVSRILDGEGRIVELPNNYSKISFDFGPTLLSWIEEASPETYEAILAADRISLSNFSGHGSAMAQAYNHMIMPLANRRDKYTQVLWGIKDFEHRFGRSPEGMWLPETAVDIETLDIMAQLGIRFTILSTHQASEVRDLNQGSWTDVSGRRIDPTMAYQLNLPSGGKISIFFYDGPISQAVSFEHLLSSGEHLLQRLMGAFSEERPGPQLVHIATDGETYGHHQQHGDMALAYALQSIESDNQIQLTNYGEFLEKYPPAHEVRIFENTAWSCAHGVERWRSNCGCNSGGYPGWNQEWRAPLRAALDWLRDTLAPLYEEQAGRYLKDPWEARNDYIRVVLDRSSDNLDHFLMRHASRDLDESEKVTVLKLLGAQRCAMLMYTSCGWFFDELSGIETVQVIQYAGRAVSLMETTCGIAIEPDFLARLEQAKSNIPEHRDGRLIYEKFVKPASVDLERVTTHYAVSSIFEERPEQDRIFCYSADREDFHLDEVGNARLALGRVRISSIVTREAAELSFAALYFGEQNLSAGVQVFQDQENYAAMCREVTESFNAGDFPETILRIDRHFGSSTYSLRSLFRDELRRVLNRIMESSLEGTRLTFRQIYNRYGSFMRFLMDLGTPLPEPLPCASDFVLNLNLKLEFEEPELSSESIHNIIKDAKALHIELDDVGLEYTLRKRIEKLAQQFRLAPDDPGILKQLLTAVSLGKEMPFEINLWTAQNIYFEMLHTVLPERRWKTEHGAGDAREWVGVFIELGRKLSVRVD